MEAIQTDCDWLKRQEKPDEIPTKSDKKPDPTSGFEIFRIGFCRVKKNPTKPDKNPIRYRVFRASDFDLLNLAHTSVCLMTQRISTCDLILKIYFIVLIGPSDFFYDKPTPIKLNDSNHIKIFINQWRRNYFSDHKL